MANSHQKYLALDCTMIMRSYMYTRKSSGAKTVPWKTSDIIFDQLESSPLKSALHDQFGGCFESILDMFFLFDNDLVLLVAARGIL